MRAVIVYESMFGRTRAIAEAIASGIGDYAETTLVRAGDVGGSVLYDADLAVVGCPTHTRTMPQPVTRKAAPGYAKKHDSDLALEPGAVGSGVREWLSSLGEHMIYAAAFDTRTEGPASLTGRASRAISRSLAHHGMSIVAPPESFLVDEDSTLLPGEMARAAAWGATLGQAVRTERAQAITNKG